MLGSIAVLGSACSSAEPAEPQRPARESEFIVVSVTPDNAELAAGDSVQLTGAVTPPAWTVQRWAWTSSDSTLVSISADGWARAKRSGVVVITVTAFGGQGHRASGVTDVLVH